TIAWSSLALSGHLVKVVFFQARSGWGTATARAFAEPGHPREQCGVGEACHPELELSGHRCVVAELSRLDRRCPVVAQASLRQRGQLGCQLFRRIAHGAVGHDPADETDPQRLVRADRAPGEDEVQGLAEPDEPWQPDGAAVHERHAPAPAEYAEDRALL